jgi:hypothetical protein
VSPRDKRQIGVIGDDLVMGGTLAEHLEQEGYRVV